MPRQAIRPIPPRWIDALDQWIILGVALVVLLIALSLRVEEGRYVVVRWLNFTLPGSCTWQMLFGWDCPGCGLTRSFVSLAHGNLLQGVRFNPAGPFLFAVLLAQFPYRAAQLWRHRTGRPLWQLGWLGWVVGLAMTAIILTQWIVRMQLGWA